jgi:hypothetical protein
MRRRKNPASVAIVAGLAAIIGVGLLVYAAGNSSAEVVDNVPGVTVNSGVRLNSRQWNYIRALRSVVASNVPIKVTSGMRTYEGQLNAMWTYYQKDPVGFKDLYNVAADRLIKLPQSMWLAEIVKLYDADILHKDGHLTGGAIDIHISSLNSAERNAIIAGVVKTGGTYIVESLPLLHVDLPK